MQTSLFHTNEFGRGLNMDKNNMKLKEYVEERGWFFSDEDLNNFSCNGERNGEDTIKAALQVDLRTPAKSFFPENLNQVSWLNGPRVVQVCRVHVRSSDDSEDKIKKIILSDGERKCEAVIEEEIENLTARTVPGTKLLLEGRITVRNQALQLNPHVLTVLHIPESHKPNDFKRVRQDAGDGMKPVSFSHIVSNPQTGNGVGVHQPNFEGFNGDGINATFAQMTIQKQEVTGRRPSPVDSNCSDGRSGSGDRSDDTRTYGRRREDRREDRRDDRRLPPQRGPRRDEDYMPNRPTNSTLFDYVSAKQDFPSDSADKGPTGGGGGSSDERSSDAGRDPVRSNSYTSPRNNSNLPPRLRRQAQPDSEQMYGGGPRGEDDRHMSGDPRMDKKFMSGHLRRHPHYDPSRPHEFGRFTRMPRHMMPDMRRGGGRYGHRPRFAGPFPHGSGGMFRPNVPMRHRYDAPRQGFPGYHPSNGYQNMPQHHSRYEYHPQSEDPSMTKGKPYEPKGDRRDQRYRSVDQSSPSRVRNRPEEAGKEQEYHQPAEPLISQPPPTMSSGNATQQTSAGADDSTHITTSQYGITQQQPSLQAGLPTRGVQHSAGQPAGHGQMSNAHTNPIAQQMPASSQLPAQLPQQTQATQQHMQTGQPTHANVQSGQQTHANVIPPQLITSNTSYPQQAPDGQNSMNYQRITAQMDESHLHNVNNTMIPSMTQPEHVSTEEQQVPLDVTQQQQMIAQQTQAASFGAGGMYDVQQQQQPGETVYDLPQQPTDLFMLQQTSTNPYIEQAIPDAYTVDANGQIVPVTANQFQAQMPISIDDQVMAKYAGDNQFYFAQVCNIDVEKRVVRVLYLDYNDEAEVSDADVRPIIHQTWEQKPPVSSAVVPISMAHVQLNVPGAMQTAAAFTGYPIHQQAPQPLVPVQLSTAGAYAGHHPAVAQQQLSAALSPRVLVPAQNFNPQSFNPQPMIHTTAALQAHQPGLCFIEPYAMHCIATSMQSTNPSSSGRGNKYRNSGAVNVSQDTASTADGN